MEMQAISRAVRIGQTNVVNVISPYTANTVDDIHKQKHYFKTDQSSLVTGDSKVDPMYEDIYDDISSLEKNDSSFVS